MKTLLSLLALALLSAGALSQTFTVTGNFQYEDKAWTYQNGWTGADPSLPVRRADVFVLNNATQAVLGSGSTDQNGDFSIQATSIGTADIVVRCDSDTNLDGSFQRVRATNTSGGADYSVFSPVFSGHDTATPLDVGTSTALKLVSGGREGNPFNMLDMAVHAWEYITGPVVNDTNTFSTPKVSWPGGSGSFASGDTAHMAADDGYDDAVILHELGHVIHNLYSDSDSPGGSHSFGESNQEPRLSLGEGYATFLACTVMIEQIGVEGAYMDAFGTSQTGGIGLRARLETRSPWTGTTVGAADELAVAAALFDLLDDELSVDQSPGVDDDDMISTTLINGDNVHRAWWDVFEGPVNAASNLTLNDCWDGWFSEHGVGGMHPEVEDAFLNQSILFSNDVDDPGNNTLGSWSPVASIGSWSSNRTLYTSSATPPAPGSGDRDWYGVDLVVGSVIDIETRYPNGQADANTQCDPELGLWDPNDTKLTSNEDGGTGRNAAILNFTVTESGLWQFRVRSTHSYRRYGRYNYRIRYDFENLLPQISSGPTAMPSNILEGQTAQLSVTATDAQTLTYTWTPLDGGSIVGSGAVVDWQAPATVPSTTDYHVQLVITDSLGAETAPVQVTITVDPSGAGCGGSAAVASGGTGKAGQFGVPVLATLNLPVIPSANFALSGTNLLPSSPVYLIAGFTFANAPFDQGTLYPSVDFVKIFNTTGGGALFLPFPLSDPAFCGLETWWQLLVPGDPGATGFKQTSQTNWVKTTLGS